MRRQCKAQDCDMCAGCSIDEVDCPSAEAAALAQARLGGIRVTSLCLAKKEDCKRLFAGPKADQSRGVILVDAAQSSCFACVCACE